MSVHSEFMGLLYAVTPALRVHDGTVKAADGTVVPPVGAVKSPIAFPYVLVQGSTPRPNGRSAARTPVGGRYRYRTTIASLDPDSVRIYASRVTKALEGKRIAGARIEGVPNDMPILPDLDVTINSTHPSYVVLEWLFVTPSA